MKQITLEVAILISVIAICISSITIATITHDDCSVRRGFEVGAFDRPHPSRGHGGQGMGVYSRHGGAGRNQRSSNRSNFKSRRLMRNESSEYSRRGQGRQGSPGQKQDGSDSPSLK
jgi:hypothetical protein